MKNIISITRLDELTEEIQRQLDDAKYYARKGKDVSFHATWEDLQRNLTEFLSEAHKEKRNA